MIMNIKIKQNDILDYNIKNNIGNNGSYLAHKIDHYDFKEAIDNNEFVKNVFSEENIKSNAEEILVTFKKSSELIQYKVNFKESGNILEIDICRVMVCFKYIIKNNSKYGNDYDFQHVHKYYTKTDTWIPYLEQYILNDKINLGMSLNLFHKSSFIENKDKIQQIQHSKCIQMNWTNYAYEGKANIIHLTRDIIEVEKNARQDYFSHEHTSYQSYLIKELSKKLNIKFHNC